jgi:hypothetical protein
MLDVALSLGAPANIEPQSCPNVIAPKHSSDTRNPLSEEFVSHNYLKEPPN